LTVDRGASKEADHPRPLLEKGGEQKCKEVRFMRAEAQAHATTIQQALDLLRRFL